MRKTQKLYDMTDLFIQYQEWKQSDPDNEMYELIYQDEDENDVFVAGGNSMMMYLAEHYATFFYHDFGARISARLEQEYTPNAAFLDLIQSWEHFCSMHPEYIRMAQMLNRTDYDPLENYDRKEDGGWKDTEDDDAIHSMEYAEVTTTTENDPRIKTKTTGSVYGDNSTTPVPDTESITEPVRDAATDVDTIKTTTPLHTDKRSVEGDKVMTRLFQDYRVHGNIGVTTAAQMIEGEAKVRSKLVLEPMIYDAFVKEHFTLVREVRV